MEVWNNVRLLNQMEAVKSQNRIDTEGQLLYILNPFIASLGYDIYDITRVDTQVQAGRIVVKVSDEVTIIFSVTSIIPKQSGDMFVAVDAKRHTIELHLFAMGSWERVELVDLSKTPEEIGEAYANIIRMVAQEACQIMYAERGKRMFTERILATKLLQGDMQNAFLVAAVKKLFDEPTDALLACLAETLADEFSTDSVQNLQAQLRPLKEQGFRKLVSRYLQDNVPLGGGKSEIMTQPTVAAPSSTTIQPIQSVQTVQPIQPVTESAPVTPKIEVTDRPTRGSINPISESTQTRPGALFGEVVVSASIEEESAHPETTLDQSPMREPQTDIKAQMDVDVEPLDKGVPKEFDTKEKIEPVTPTQPPAFVDTKPKEEKGTVTGTTSSDSFASNPKPTIGSIDALFGSPAARKSPPTRSL